MDVDLIPHRVRPRLRPLRGVGFRRLRATKNPARWPHEADVAPGTLSARAERTAAAMRRCTR